MAQKLEQYSGRSAVVLEFVAGIVRTRAAEVAASNRSAEAAEDHWESLEGIDSVQAVLCIAVVMGLD